MAAAGSLLSVAVIALSFSAHPFTPTHAQEAGTPTTLLTLNMNLLSTIPTRTAFGFHRRAALTQTIGNKNSSWNDADVICLQEMNVDADRTKVVAEAKKAGFTYSTESLRLETPAELTAKNTGGVACNLMIVTEIAGCVPCASAAAISVEHFVDCLLSNPACGGLVSKLSQSCINCLIQTPGSVSDIVTKCATEMATTYASHLAIMMLSKRSMSNMKLVPFNTSSAIIRRGYIQATVDGVGNVLCTHQTSTRETLNDTAALNTLAAINLEETKLIFKAAEATDSVVIGDFNFGPAVTTAAGPAVALHLPSYMYAESLGYRSLYAASSMPQCTFCKTNPLVQLQAFAQSATALYKSNLIDHVFVKPSRYNTSNPQLVYVPWNIETNSSAPFPPMVPLSDHYGVQVAVLRLPLPSSSATSQHLTTALLCASVGVALLSSLF